MPLNTAPRAGSVNSNTPSRVIDRQPVHLAKPTQSSARAAALKDRLSGKAPTQPVAPRPMGSSARREEMSKLEKFSSPQAQQPSKPIPAKTSARVPDKDLGSIELPPSGLSPRLEGAQTSNIIETPEPAVEANNEPLSPQFVALARKERQLRKAQQELKASQDAWKQEQANHIPKERLNSETLKVLAEAGITPDKLVELQINQAASQDPNQILLNRIADLEAKLTNIIDPENGELAKRDKAAYDQVVSQIRQDATLLVESNPSFGTIRSEGKISDVVDLITKVFDVEGVALDVEEAAQLVEDKLVDNLYKQYEKLSKYDKILAKLGKKTESLEATPPQQSAQINTLTNAGSLQKQLTPRERAILKVQDAINANKR